jgi:thiol-disulfide isomerase/thioredoxin
MSKILVGIPYLEDTDINPDGSLKPHVGNGKPVILMVQGDFCGYCTKAKPDFQKFAKSSNVVAVTIQTDGGESDRKASKAIAVVNKSPGVPAFLGFDKNGKYVKTHQGNRDFASLEQFSASL